MEPTTASIDPNVTEVEDIVTTTTTSNQSPKVKDIPQQSNNNSESKKNEKKNIEYLNSDKTDRTKDGKVKIIETESYIPKQFIDYYAECKDKTEEEAIMLRSTKVLENLENSLMDEKEISKESMELFVIELNNFNFTTIEDWRKKGMRPLCKKYQINPKKAAIRKVYMNLLHKNKITQNINFENFLITKAMRTQSGVMVVTVFTSPFPRYDNKIQRFSCKHNCYFCPNEPNMPRSYLSDEPGVQRGWKHNWDPIEQFYARVWTYYVNGHPIDKCELLVLGGTWSEYPHKYQETFLRDCFYSANTFFEKDKRLPKSLLQEQKINESAKCRIIGVTLETRPDTITIDELRRMRYYGCTRIQIGIQHISNEILSKINRGCTNEDAIHAVELLKNVGFKIDFHLMPDLPGSTPLLDEQMFYYVLNSLNLQADQWKIYPCQTTPFTVIEKWYKNNEYKPFTPEELLNVLIKVKSHVHPWIRLNRVIRDIPNQYIIGGNIITNLRQVLETEMKLRHLNCKCIRCREVKAKDCNPKLAKMFIRNYQSSNGNEYFISYELKDESTIFGFVRLRLCNENSNNITKEVFPELDGCAMVRELHVYGQLRPVGNDENISAAETPDNTMENNNGKNSKKQNKKNKNKNKKNDQNDTNTDINKGNNNNKSDSSSSSNNNDDKVKKGHKTQHLGFGKRLMRTAEIIASIYGFRKICVIAGIGTRNYYRKLGYKLKGTYMIKDIQTITYYKFRLIYKLNIIQDSQPYYENCKPRQGKSWSQIRKMQIENEKQNKKKKKQKRIRNKGTLYPGPRYRNNKNFRKNNNNYNDNNDTNNNNNNNNNNNKNDNSTNEIENDRNDNENEDENENEDNDEMLFDENNEMTDTRGSINNNNNNNIPQKTVLMNFDTKLAKYNGVEPLRVIYYQLGYNEDAVYNIGSKLLMVMVCCFAIVLFILWKRGEFDE